MSSHDDLCAYNHIIIDIVKQLQKSINQNDMRKGFNLSSSLSIANKLLRRKKYVKSRIERREEERRKTFCHWLKHSSSSRFAHKHSGKNIKRFLWRRDNKNLENPTPQNMCCTHIQHKKPRAAVIRSIISVPSKRVRESE